MAKREYPNQEVRKKYEEQKNNTDWTLYSERELYVNITNNRFNFLLIFYSLIITAFSTIKGTINKIIILSIGFLIVFSLTIAVIRIINKLQFVIKLLKKLDEYHVFPLMKEGSGNIDANNILKFICYILNLSLIAAIIALATGFWQFSC